MTDNVLYSLGLRNWGKIPTEIILVDDKPFVTVSEQSARVYKVQNNFSKALTVDDIMTAIQL